jgi:hypothetical protein
MTLDKTRDASIEQCKMIKPKAMVLHYIKRTLKVMPSHAHRFFWFNLEFCVVKNLSLATTQYF